MKILIITNHSYMLYQFRRELICELMKENEVVLSMPFVGHEGDFMKMGLRCIDTSLERRSTNPITDLKLFISYLQILRQEKPDMVITYSIKPNVYGGIACQIKRIPYYVNVQGLGTAFQKKRLARIVTIMYRMALNKAETVFFENEENADLFRRKHIVSPEKIVALKGAGINLEHYEYVPYPQSDCIRFLFVGRIMKEKGVDELFYAARRLKKEFKDRFALDIVGFFEDAYKEEVNRLQQEGVITFRGFQKDVRPYYGSCSCVVLPSYHEGMSNVLLEGAAVGRPLITSDIPGCREAVEDGRNGFLCEVKSGESLYRAMKKFLEIPYLHREEMARLGRARMQEQFDKKVIVDRTVGKIMNSGEK